MPVIDCHIHFQSPDGRYDQAEVDRCLRLADDVGIDRLVYLFNLGTGGVDPTPDDIRTSNDLGLMLLDRHPDRFVGFCYLNPAHDPAFSLAEIDRCVAKGPMQGIKLWISVHATDPRLDPIMARAGELGAPVVRAPHRNPPEGEGNGPGHREIWIRDPDGYTVVVASPDGEAYEP